MGRCFDKHFRLLVFISSHVQRNSLKILPRKKVHYISYVTKEKCTGFRKFVASTASDNFLLAKNTHNHRYKRI